LYKFDAATLKYKRFLTSDGLLNNWTHGLLSLGNNLFLLSTHTGFQIYDEAKDSFYNEANSPVLKKLLAFHKGDEVLGILKDPHGKIWFGTWRPGFYCYDSATDTVKEIILDSSDKKKNFDKVVTSVVEDDRGNLYIGTRHAGIYYFNPHTNKTEHHFLNDPSDPSSLISSSVSSLFYDNQKTLWIGTDAGISKFSKANNQFSYPFFQNKSDFIPSALLQSRDGNIWVGTYAGEGLFEFDKNFKQLHQYKIFEGSDNFKENGIESLNETAKGDIMVCRQGGFSLINALTGEQNDFISIKELSSTSTIEAFEDEKKQVWIGCGKSKLICLDSTHKHVAVFPAASDTYIMGNNKNKLLILFYDKGFKLFCFDIATKKFYREPYYFFKQRDSTFVRQAEKLIKNVKVYNDEIYFPTRNGLYVFTKSFDTVQYYNRVDGLPSNHVYSVEKDASGNAWLTTGNGLSVFNPKTRIFRNYGESDGLQRLEFNEDANILKLDNNMMLACDVNTVVAFSPDSMMNLPIPPQPVITSLHIGNEEIPVSSNGKYNVSYKANTIRINYASLDFINTKSLNYAYKLQGFDKDWNYVGNTTTATYTNLDGGNYTLKIKVANSIGKWNETATALTFFVSSPFYKQAWFFVLIGIIIITASYAFYRTGVQRILELQRLRNSISRDLHDEVGSTLSSISMLSTSAKYSLQNNQTKPAEMLVQRISSSSQRILEVMDDIIWTINPKNDSLENIIARIRELMNDIADSKGIKFNMQIDPLLETLLLPMKLKRNFYLIFKEAVANAGNHSQCKAATVSIQRNNQTIILEIEDDRAGFDVEKKFNGNGLKNMQQRAIEIKGTLDISSEINKGTVLKLTIPIP
jgi:two-component sensor histidine kinase